jgi:hypothetical protein
LCWANRVGSMFWLAELKTEPCGLSFGPIRTNKSANHRGSACGEVGVVLEVMARCVGPIERGAHFGWQNRKPSGTGSVLVRYAQIKARILEGVRAVGLVW